MTIRELITQLNTMNPNAIVITDCVGRDLYLEGQDRVNVVMYGQLFESSSRFVIKDLTEDIYFLSGVAEKGEKGIDAVYIASLDLSDPYGDTE